MQVFVRVVELGGFARAADRLEISAASVTHQIAQLEAHLGVRLLNRTTRRLSLTDDGAAYLEHCKRVLADVEETVETLRRGRLEPQGRLRIDMPASIGRHIVVPALPRFADQYPAVQLTVTLEDRLIDLFDEGVDAAIRVGTLPDSSLIARRLYDFGFTVCASPDYLAVHGVPESPEALARHRTIGHFNLSTHRIIDWVFEQDGRRVVHTPGAALALSDPEAIVELAIAGKGIVYHADMLMRRALAAGALQPILTDWVLRDRLPVSLVYPHNRHLSAKVRAFSDFVAGLFPRRDTTK